MWFYSIELFLVISALFFFFWSLKKEPDTPTLESLAPFWGLVILLAGVMSLDFRGSFFANTYVLDPFSQWMKVIIGLGYFVTCFISKGIKDIDDRYKAEYFLFLTTATLGMVVMVSAKDLITLYTALELSSYSLYLLVPMRKRENLSSEAGIKYLLVGVAASGIMIYGFSLLFGLTQTTYLSEIAAKIPDIQMLPVFWLAFFLSLSGFLFKLSLFPFHAWAPDVYEEGNTQVIGFISTVSKVAGLAVFIRLMLLVGNGTEAIQNVWVIIAILTMTIGNLAALVQVDLKRLLGYSSIAQAGYLLVGVLCLTQKGVSAAIFYIGVYVVMNLTAFFIITQLSKDSRNVSTADVKGLYKRNPLLALTLMVSFFSLAGIPPLAGFTGKWFIFSAAINEGYSLLAIIAIANSIASLYYYLMIVKNAYSDEEAPSLEPITLKPSYKFLCYSSMVFLAVCGFFPGWLMSFAKQSIALFFAF